MAQEVQAGAWLGLGYEGRMPEEQGSGGYTTGALTPPFPAPTLAPGPNHVDSNMAGDLGTTLLLSAERIRSGLRAEDEGGDQG